MIGKNTAAGVLAGLAGTTALNAVTYLDMVLRGRPASTAPEHSAERLAARGGVGIPGNDEERRNRLQGLGGLSGIATGVLVGAAAGLGRPVIRRLGPVAGPAVLGGAAMAVTDVSMYRLGVTNPASWDRSSWVSDALPHLAFGAAAWALLALAG